MMAAKNRISLIRSLLLLLLLLLSYNCEKNQTPIIQNIDVNPTELEVGGQALLMVVASDPDGDPLIYLWEAGGGEIATDNSLPSISWKAPVESGSYYCTISISDGSEIVSDSIQITVREDPVLSIDRDTLYFDTDRNLENFSIANLGTGLLDWTLQYTTNDGGSWIKQVSPDQGATSIDNPVSVEVYIDRSGLSGGIYLGTINISSDDENAKVHILVDVAELVVMPSSLNFGSKDINKNITLENGGAGNLNYDITVSDNWISVDPSSGGLTNQQELVNIQVDRTGKTPGSYSGQVVIASNAGEIIVPIQMSIVDSPILEINTDILDFGLTVSNRSFFIQNSGGGTLNWTISESLDWLTVNQLNGSTSPTETNNIQVVVDRSVLSPGTYSNVIIVTSNGGNANIKVSIQVEASGEWLKYDDDNFEGQYDTDANHLFFLTQFDRPSDWKKYRITKLAISFPPFSSRDNIELFCFSTQEIAGNYWPYQNLFQTAQVDPGGGWNEWAVDWILDLDRFCAGYRQIEEKAPSVHYDKNANIQRSYYVNTDMRGIHVDDINWAIRVYVEKTDGEPAPGQWLDIIVKPVIGTSIEKSRLIPDKNTPL